MYCKTAVYAHPNRTGTHGVLQFAVEVHYAEVVG